MGNILGIANNIKKVNFEDIQGANLEHVLIINTLEKHEQKCLIKGTLDYTKEEDIINMLIKNGNKNKVIYIYGKNYNDEKLYLKYNQLTMLGFTNVYIYPGGMFEWLLLQDIYDVKNFQTSSIDLDILKYKPKSCFFNNYLTNS
jgi:rhodanese-related sulfurtransferase